MSSTIKEDGAAPSDGQAPSPHPTALYSFFPSDDRLRRPSTNALPPQYSHLFTQQGLLANTTPGASFSAPMPPPQLGYNDLGPRPSTDFAVPPQAQRLGEYVMPVDFARESRWNDVRRYMEVIRKISTDFNQLELTKEKYYELYNVGVSLLRTIDMLDPEKGRRPEMGARESFSYPVLPGGPMPPNPHQQQPPMPSGSFDLDAVLAGHKPSFAAEFYAARSSFSDPIYAAQAAAAAAAQFAASNSMQGHPQQGHPTHPQGHPQGHPHGGGGSGAPTPTPTYALYAAQQQSAASGHPQGHPQSSHHPSNTAQQSSAQHHMQQQHHPGAHPASHPHHPQHHPQSGHPPPPSSHGHHHPAAAAAMHSASQANSVANRMKNFTGEVFFDDVSESRKPKRRRRRTVFSTKRNLRCHMCNATETPEWRRGPDGDHTLCNACGLHYAKTLKKERKAREGRKHSIDILLNESQNSTNAQSSTANSQPLPSAAAAPAATGTVNSSSSSHVSSSGSNFALAGPSAALNSSSSSISGSGTVGTIPHQSAANALIPSLSSAQKANSTQQLPPLPSSASSSSAANPNAPLSANGIAGGGLEKHKSGGEEEDEGDSEDSEDASGGADGPGAVGIRLETGQ